MLLAADIGNTEIALGLFQNGRLIQPWRLRTDLNKNADEYGALLISLMQAGGQDPKQVERVCAASVVPALTQTFFQACAQYLRCEPRIATAESNLGIQLDVDNPSEVGADRALNALAVLRLYPLPAVVVDFGTATNLDVVGEGGVFRGGAFMPGIQISMDALFQKASMLKPLEKIEKPKRAIGRNTSECIQSGLYYGYLGQMERMIERIAEELDAKPTVVATGGLSSLLAPHSELVDAIDPYLTLKGLLFADERLRGQP